MLLPLAAALSLFRPIAFPPQPLAGEVRRGAAVYMAGKGIDRVALEDRTVIGFWFDGRIRRDVEDTLWVSPSFVSRWLGYLEAQEKWPEGVLEARWGAVRHALDGSLLIVVRLSAFPRSVDPEFGLPGRGDPAGIENVRFALTAGGEWPEARSARSVPSALRALGATRPGGGLNLPLRPFLARQEQARSWQSFEQVPWYSLVPIGDLVWPEFATPQPARGLSLGAYHAAWYVLHLPVPDTLRARKGFELRIFSPGKERIATFPLVGKDR